MTKSAAAVVRRTEYFKGLNYLIDDKPDQAIEVFTHMADVDRDTAEIHLALGNLFRRRGEVDRAIHIHSSLVARTKLTVGQRRSAMMELGEDYLRAGLFDRAEALFQELLKQPDCIAVAVARLIYICQQEKDWQRAIEYGDRLEQISGESKGQETAHFCCELAEAANARGEDAEARSWLLAALKRDPDCVRANLLLGNFAMQAGHYPAAIESFQAVERQDRGYFPEVIVPLSRCFAALGQVDEWLRYLQAVQSQDHSGRVTDALAEWLLKQQGETAALGFLEAELKDYPTLLGLRRLVEIKLQRGKVSESTDLQALYCISTQMLNNTARYRCANCGFVVKTLHWCCPSCLRWNTIKPISDLVIKTSA